MGQKFPVGTVPTAVGGIVEAGMYRVSIPLLTEERTKDGSKLKYDSNIGFRITAGEMEGLSIWDHNAFVIGLVDPDGQLSDPDDWKKMGGRLFNNMMHAAGVDESEEVDEMLAAAEGKEVLAQVQVEKDTAGVYPDKNRLRGFFPVRDTIEPAKPAGRPGPTRVPTPIRTAAPAPAVREVSPRGQTSAPAGRPAAPRDTPQKCDLCEPRQDIPRPQYGKHVAAHDKYPDEKYIPHAESMAPGWSPEQTA